MTQRTGSGWCARVVWTLVLAGMVGSEAASAWFRQTTASASAEISGSVMTTSNPPAPLARVLVTASGGSLKTSRTTISDEQGRFAFRDLPPGNVTIVAARPPYVAMAFGAKRPGRPGTAISLAPGQRVPNISIALPRGAAIAGLIRHAGGEPAVGVNVVATPLDPISAAHVLQVTTDDRGEYRIFGLPRGRYAIAAGVTESASAVLTQLSEAEMDATIARLQRRTSGLSGSTGSAAGRTASASGPASEPSRRLATYGYAPIFYPGTPEPDRAQIVELSEGEERAGVDIRLQFSRTMAVAGRVSNPTGSLPPGTQVTLTRIQEGTTLSSLAGSRVTRPVDAKGEFQFTGVLPGRYRVVASVRVTTGPRPGVLWALSDVAIADDDVSGVVMTLQEGIRLAGHSLFESRSRAKPNDLTSMLVRLVDTTGASSIPGSGTSRADGTFEISGIVPGTYTFTSLLREAGWQLRSVMIGGRDVLDFPLEIAGDVSGAVATFTDQHAELSGTLQSAPNVPAPDYFVVVFSRDHAFWRLGSRRVQTARPNTAGRFVFPDLPAGDYLLAALTDVEPSDLGDQGFLEALVPGAVPVSMADGEKKTQDLRIVGRVPMPDRREQIRSRR